MRSEADIRAIVAANTSEDGDCLLWTRGCSGGHPSWRFGVGWKLVRRVLHEHIHGPIPAGKKLRVTCGNRRCLNEAHWFMTNHKGIMRDCSSRGLMGGRLRAAKVAAIKRAGPQAKITQEDARAIRVSEEPGAALAARYGISESTVSKIRRGQRRREFAGNVWAGLA